MRTLLQPGWLFCAILFVWHQLAQKVLGWSWLWADSYLDDLLCMPILLGLALANRRYFIQDPRYTFSFFEITVMVIALSILFEEGYPRWWSSFTRDPWDYAYYALGGLWYYWGIQPKAG